MYSSWPGPYPSHSTGPNLHGLRYAHQNMEGSYIQGGVLLRERSGENDGDQINVASVPGGSNNQNGTFNFRDARAGLGATSGVGVANLALGLADSYTEIGPRAYTIYRGFLYEWFAQDSWKVSQKLHSTTAFARRSTSLQGTVGKSDFFDPALYTASSAPKVDKVPAT